MFPRWTNKLPFLSLGALVVLLGGGGAALWYWGSPKNLDVGYSPEQPIAFSHALHNGDLGMDCRYCHTTVETSATASIPPTQICMNCHDPNTGGIKKGSPEIKKLIAYHTDGNPVPWVRVHKVPDFAYFVHNRHVTRGVGCAECHGRIDKMERVQQVEPLSMSWCLDCHRNPGPHLRPPEFVTRMNWQPPPGETRESVGRMLMQKYQDQALPVRPPAHDAFAINCSGCHH